MSNCCDWVQQMAELVSCPSLQGRNFFHLGKGLVVPVQTEAEMEVASLSAESASDFLNDVIDLVWPSRTSLGFTALPGTRGGKVPMFHSERVKVAASYLGFLLSKREFNFDQKKLEEIICKKVCATKY